MNNEQITTEQIQEMIDRSLSQGGFIASIGSLKIEAQGINAGPRGYWYEGTTSGITASTTQTQGEGQLGATVNEVSVVANANDTVTLPTAIPGRKVIIINNGANTLQIFPFLNDNLGAGVDTATTLASGSNVTFIAYNAVNWEII